MERAIREFPKQFTFDPIVENAEHLEQRSRSLIVGLGGSALAPGLMRVWDPEIDMVTHRMYGLPERTDLSERLIVASSYSGNTEETRDAYRVARERNLPVAVVAVGGALLEAAQRDGVPYVALPDTGIQPRMALGFSVLALARLIGNEQLLEELRAVAGELDGDACAQRGRDLAATLQGKIPVIYASDRNRAIAYNWKIKFNETGKIPAFLNVFPELNHNEMTGYDATDATRSLSDRFHFLFLQDSHDHPRIVKRMEVTQRLYEDRGFPVTMLELNGATAWERIASSLLLADWTAFATANAYGVEAEQVPMVEEFKGLIR